MAGCLYLAEFTACNIVSRPSVNPKKCRAPFYPLPATIAWCLAITEKHCFQPPFRTILPASTRSTTMTPFQSFHTLIVSLPRPVILLEGTREVPLADLPRLTSFAAWLASKFPWAVFRSGNAKVTGIPEAGFTKADFGIFYTNPTDPMKGGTGHTIRVCQKLGVPVAFQGSWMRWRS